MSRQKDAYDAVEQLVRLLRRWQEATERNQGPIFYQLDLPSTVERSSREFGIDLDLEELLSATASVANLAELKIEPQEPRDVARRLLLQLNSCSDDFLDGIVWHSLQQLMAAQSQLSATIAAESGGEEQFRAARPER